mgnify:CR=1 FL=1
MLRRRIYVGSHILRIMLGRRIYAEDKNLCWVSYFKNYVGSHILRIYVGSHILRIYVGCNILRFMLRG